MIQSNFQYYIVLAQKEIRGDIARIYFYMSKTYNIKLSKEEIKIFEKWDLEEPVSSWGKVKNEKIFETIKNYFGTKYLKI